MDLVKQLEDKKKELRRLEKKLSDIGKKNNVFRIVKDERLKIRFQKHITHCKEIIVILEQAIAEMQKQRQEILDKIDDLDCSKIDNAKIIHPYYIFKESLKQQLNQPKTEGCGKERITNFTNTNGELCESFDGICGEDGYYCENCKKAVKNE